MGNNSNYKQKFCIAYGYHEIIEQNHQFYVRKMYHLSPQQKQPFKQLLRIVSSINIPTIMPIYTIKEYQQYHQVYFPYYQNTLEDQIKQTRNQFQELRILTMIDCVLSALMAYQYKKLYFADLRPQRIHVHEQVFILGLPILLNNQTMLQQYKNNRDMNIYLSPQIYESLDFFKPNQIQFSMQKCDIFSLGMIALHMATFQQSKEFYDIKLKRIKIRQIGKTVGNCKGIYSNQFCQLLLMMLSEDPKNRCNLQQVCQYIEPLLNRQKSKISYNSMVLQSSRNFMQSNRKDSRLDKFISYKPSASNINIQSRMQDQKINQSIPIQAQLNYFKSFQQTNQHNKTIYLTQPSFRKPQPQFKQKHNQINKLTIVPYKPTRSPMLSHQRSIHNCQSNNMKKIQITSLSANRTVSIPNFQEQRLQTSQQKKKQSTINHKNMIEKVKKKELLDEIFISQENFKNYYKFQKRNKVENHPQFDYVNI